MANERIASTTLDVLTLVTVGYCGESTTGHAARVETDTLRLVVTDNEAYGAEHRAGYNGVSELRLGRRDYTVNREFSLKVKGVGRAMPGANPRLPRARR